MPKVKKSWMPDAGCRITLHSATKEWSSPECLLAVFRNVVTKAWGKMSFPNRSTGFISVGVVWIKIWSRGNWKHLRSWRRYGLWDRRWSRWFSSSHGSSSLDKSSVSVCTWWRLLGSVKSCGTLQLKQVRLTYPVGSWAPANKLSNVKNWASTKTTR